MQKFCTKCGQKLDETGRCPHCQPTKKEARAQKKEEKKALKKAAKKEAWKKLPLKKKIKKICFRGIAVILIAAILAAGAVGTLVYFNMVDIPIVAKLLDGFGIKKYETDDNISSTEHEDSDEDMNTQYSVEHPDADEYYHNNSTVISEGKVTDSNVVFTETDAYNTLSDRGFGSYPITTEYSMSGEYMDAVNISPSSTTKHPIYQTTYFADNGEVWEIFLINNIILANPLSYNVQSHSPAQIIVSETDSVMSYDNITNKFYETIPNESQAIIKKIEHIDAQSLDNMDIGAND